jgi:hypothetical protein
MQGNRFFSFIKLLLTAGCALSGVSALAATPFAITAANVTMPTAGPTTNSSGVTSTPLGSSQFTVTGIPGAGTLIIGCQYSGPVTTAKIPQECGPAGDPGIPVEAGETTLNGIVYFAPYGLITPSLGKLHSAPSPAGGLPAAGMALAGALMLGFGFRRWARRWLVLGVFAVCGLAGAAGISGCGANNNAMTPGTYAYTISAQLASADGSTLIGAPITTTVMVTVL